MYLDLQICPSRNPQSMSNTVTSIVIHIPKECHSPSFVWKSPSPSAGITAASGISAELGIPLTHRGVATGVAFITGHAREGGEDELDDSVAASADPHTTLVVYMGLNTLPALLRRLEAAGLPPDTPAVAVERGTTVHQRAVYATLGRLTEARRPLVASFKGANERGRGRGVWGKWQAVADPSDLIETFIMDRSFFGANVLIEQEYESEMDELGTLILH